MMGGPVIGTRFQSLRWHNPDQVQRVEANAPLSMLNSCTPLRAIPLYDEMGA